MRPGEVNPSPEEACMTTKIRAAAIATTVAAARA